MNFEKIKLPNFQQNGSATPPSYSNPRQISVSAIVLRNELTIPFTLEKVTEGAHPGGREEHD